MFDTKLFNRIFADEEDGIKEYFATSNSMKFVPFGNTESIIFDNYLPAPSHTVYSTQMQRTSIVLDFLYLCQQLHLLKRPLVEEKKILLLKAIIKTCGEFQEYEHYSSVMTNSV